MAEFNAVIATDHGEWLTVGGEEEPHLYIEGENWPCVTIEITRPDRARYILKGNELEKGAERSRAVPLRTYQEANADNLPGIRGFFNMGGIYTVSVWPFTGAMPDGFVGDPKPVYRQDLSYNFPNCAHSEALNDGRIAYLQNFEGPLVKTRLGYQKHILGDGFESFDVDIAFCNSVELSIDIKGAHPEKRLEALNMAIDILGQVQEYVVNLHADNIRQLGNGETELHVGEDDIVTVLDGTAARHDGRYDIKLDLVIGID